MLLHAGFSISAALFYNFLSALGALVGAFAVLVLQDIFGPVKFFLVPFTAGSFLYIAGTDLLAELQRHRSHGFARHTIWLIIGMGVMVMVSLVAHIH